jgi:hypothetical protein
LTENFNWDSTENTITLNIGVYDQKQNAITVTVTFENSDDLWSSFVEYPTNIHENCTDIIYDFTSFTVDYLNGIYVDEICNLLDCNNSSSTFYEYFQFLSSFGSYTIYLPIVIK